ncbi:MAG TPA: Mur ligase domain-containing protein, partial [Lentisphaeria bacterium]|nr:Mur ligase domain-containing protein [Lentisphaeria bacterium]
MTTLPTSRPLAEYRQALTCCLLESDNCSDAVAITGATADSRAVKPGYLFCAIRGAKLDGHDFIPQALAAGAAALVLERPVPGLPVGQPQLLVRDAYHAAALVAEVAAGLGLQGVILTGP